MTTWAEKYYLAKCDEVELLENELLAATLRIENDALQLRECRQLLGEALQDYSNIAIELDAEKINSKQAMQAVEEITAARDKLSAEIYSLRRQEPVAYLAWSDGKPCWKDEDCICEDAVYPIDSDDDRTSMAVYLAAGAQTAKEGWHLVPVEPTDEMLRAFHVAVARWLEEEGLDDDIYRAMLAACKEK